MTCSLSGKMNLGDPELELIDPTPNIFTMFVHFDKIFFSSKLASRAVVRWSKRMYSCAGVCSYEGRGGLCDIAVSEPLLKLRPRKDLVETLLHEMIHAFLFVTSRDQDRDGHGPNFQFHMHRINKMAGLNISIYHDFHDEVKLYLTHWWRCNGPCQKRRPHFGIVRRSMNRAPGPSDYWWKDHQRSCGGTFTKIKEPENMRKKAAPKSMGDITKYINTNNKETNNNVPSQKPILKPSNTNIIKTTKTNSSSTLVVTKKGNVTFNPQPLVKTKPIAVFTGEGTRISGDFNSNKVGDVKETVRNIWANKTLASTATNKTPTSTATNKNNSVKITTPKAIKHKTTSPTIGASPPMKITKIDDYFKSNAASLLKDIYGKDFNVTQSDTSKKLVAVQSSSATVLVDCPICNSKVSDKEINRHLDECLNKDEIEKLNQVNSYVDNTRSSVHPKNNPTKTSENGPKDKPKLDIETVDLSIIDYVQVGRVTGMIDLTNINIKEEVLIKEEKFNTKDFPTTSSKDTADDVFDQKTIKAIVKNIKFDTNIETTGKDIKPKEENQPYLQDNRIQIKPGTSKDIASEVNDQKCPCCGNKIDRPIEQHLDECLAFFDSTISDEEASTSFVNSSITVDDDDDIFDETQTMNATGTKAPCPCCLNMVEEADMNNHLDICLS